MGRRKHPDVHEQVQALLYAEIHGDDAAMLRFDLSRRSLQRYRDLARDPASDLAQTVASYRAALIPSERGQTFADWLLQQVRDAGGLLIEKARQADARNPEALRVLNEHVATLLDHQTATTYIDRLFAPAPDDDAAPRDPEPPQA